MSEARLYVIGAAVAFVGLSGLVLTGPGWWAWALLVGGLAAVAAGLLMTSRRTLSVRVTIEDEQLRPVPVLDAPKGTFDLIAGLTVRLDNRTDQPVGVRIDSLLYHRNRWQWDRRVGDAQPEPLLAPSVIPGRRAKSFFVKNYTRIPAEIEVLTPDYFVKLIVETSEGHKSVHRAFVTERFALPKQLPAKRPAGASSVDHPLLPFEEDLAAATAAAERERSEAAARRARSVDASRAGGRARPSRNNGDEAPDVVRIDLLKKPNDSLEGLIDELDSELEGELHPGLDADEKRRLHN